MPLYEYRCAQCGSFDRWRDTSQANVPLPCPHCSAPARRVFSAPATRTRTGSVAGASVPDRARMDRALTGEPTVTTQPRGRRPRGSHRH